MYYSYFVMLKMVSHSQHRFRIHLFVSKPNNAYYIITRNSHIITRNFIGN